jgi:hypothetical protein
MLSFKTIDASIDPIAFNPGENLTQSRLGAIGNRRVELDPALGTITTPNGRVDRRRKIIELYAHGDLILDGQSRGITILKLDKTATPADIHGIPRVRVAFMLNQNNQLAREVERGNSQGPTTV